MKQATLFLSILLVSGGWAKISQASQPNPSHLAEQLEIQGHQFLENGDPQQAYEVWERAIELHQKRHFKPAIPPLLINQSIALQHLGYPIKACTKLVLVLQLSTHLCQSHRQTTPNNFNSSTQTLQPSQNNRIIAQINLGKVLRKLGHLSQAEDFLKQAQKQSFHLSLTQYHDTATLELADLQTLTFIQTLERAQLTTSITANQKLMGQAKDSAQQALQTYKNLFLSDFVAPQSQLHWLNLFEELQNVKDDDSGIKLLIQDNIEEYQDTLTTLLNKKQPSNKSLSHLYAQLSLAKHLLSIANSDSPSIINSPQQKALAITQTVIRDAQSFQDASVITLAHQIQGESYLNLGQTQNAQNAFQQASRLAQYHNNWEGLYQAQQQLARMQAPQNPTKAIAAYELAIASLNNIRQELLPANPDFQFSFLNDVEPIYHDYIQFLLNQPHPDYQRVIALNENLRVAELVNFLRCGQLNWVSLNQLTQQKTKHATLIHILNIGDETHIIAQTPHGYHHHQAETSLVQKTLTRLSFNLRSDTFPFTNEQQIQTLAQILYQQLLEPLAPNLLPNSTLVFSLDSTFQGVPMALLHDGTQYLIESYSISTNFGSKIPSLPQERAPLKVLIAGLSKVSPSFSQVSDSSLAPLPAISQETQAIATLSKRSKLLLNETFTLPTLQQNIDLQGFPYLHIATHGSFSSDIEDTYLLAWNQKMKLDDLERLLQPFASQYSPLELLVLSACETAKGDRRAVLGLAGVATQSGAKSTLASLWKVEDSSSSQLMSHFYQGLKAGLPKAEALRQAQLQLRQSDTYHSPYYWAPFILLGHWQ